MTQKEAIEKALQKLGGRATLQEIYPLALEIGDFSGSKDTLALLQKRKDRTDEKRRLQEAPRKCNIVTL